MNLFLWILVILLGVTLVFGWGFLLFLIAELLSKVFNLIGFFWTITESIIKLKWNTGRKKINLYFKDIAISKDQHSNVVVRDFFNKIMLRNLCIPFGDPDLSLSYYYAVNKLIRENCSVDCGLNTFGLFWAKFLNIFDRSKGGHLEYAIYNQMIKEDMIMKKNGYITQPNINVFKENIINQFEKTL